MKRAIILCILIIMALPPVVAAHVPIEPEGNEALEDAFHIQDPIKSWAIYAELHQAPQYYRFDMQAGEVIYLGLIVPPFEAASRFVPTLVLLGPELDPAGSVPLEVTVPPGYEAVVVEGRLSEEAIYEPFGPGSFYWLGEIRLAAPTTGTYYAVVVPTQVGGNYGLVVGTQEAFTLTEWILNPFNVISVYLWEGQGLLPILAPASIVAVAGLVGMGIALKRRGRARDLHAWVASVASVLYFGSAAIILYQMSWALGTAPLGGEIVITIILALLPLGLGLGILRLTLSPRGFLDLRGRVKMGVLGVVGIFAWAGFLLGPALALSASLLPALKGPVQRPQSEKGSRA